MQENLFRNYFVNFDKYKVILLGAKHKFSTKELELLPKFAYIRTVKYANREFGDVQEELEDAFDGKTKIILVLNTKAKLNKELIQYLTKLRYDKRFSNFKITTIEHFIEKFLHKCYITNDDKNLDFIGEIKPYSVWQYIQKRAIDYSGVAVLFLLSSPVMLYSIYRIKKESAGEIYFRQIRVGRNSNEFECVKHRSMHKNTEFFNHYTQENDPRIFPYGSFMRKTRIDELPQMWNILKGEMHLIGPRAEWNELVYGYEQDIPYYQERHIVAPGITGWAQVMYPYGSNSEDARQKLMYDLYYIKYWSIWLEFKTIWKTAKVVIGKSGV